MKLLITLLFPILLFYPPWAGKFLSSWPTGGFSRRPQLQGVS
jgi:hypothetical protein